MPTTDDTPLMTGACELEMSADGPDEAALAQLHKLMDSAHRLVVYDRPTDDAKVLFSSADRKDILELKEALSVDLSQPAFHCMCWGSPAILLYADGTASKDEPLVRITNHHGMTIRCSLWRSDVHLKDYEKWVSWFDARGIGGPRQEIEGAIAAGHAAELNYERWINAIPQSLVSLWPKMMQSAQVSGFTVFHPAVLPPAAAPVPAEKPQWVEAVEPALREQFPDTSARIRALFSWYGSGTGPWSGYPLYESIAETLLLQYRTCELLAALRCDRLNTAEVEGAARLFAGWEFNRCRPNDCRLIPRGLRNLFLSNVTASGGDKDTVARAKLAFERPTLLRAIVHKVGRAVAKLG